MSRGSPSSTRPPPSSSRSEGRPSRRRSFSPWRWHGHIWTIGHTRGKRGRLARPDPNPRLRGVGSTRRHHGPSALADPRRGRRGPTRTEGMRQQLAQGHRPPPWVWRPWGRQPSRGWQLPSPACGWWQWRNRRRHLWGRWWIRTPPSLRRWKQYPGRWWPQLWQRPRDSVRSRFHEYGNSSSFTSSAG